MFKRLFGLAVATAVVAAGVKVVKDILNAYEEEKSVIDLDSCSNHESSCCCCHKEEHSEDTPTEE